MMKQFTYEESREAYLKALYQKHKKKYEAALKKLPKDISPTSEESIRMDKITEEYCYIRDMYFMCITRTYLPVSYEIIEESLKDYT